MHQHEGCPDLGSNGFNVVILAFIFRLENVTDQLSADKALASTDSVSPLFGAVPKTYIRVKLSRESTGSHYSHGLEDVKLWVK
ncbi:unnamed protein product [Heterobilharzia americana]|nr:unnamed protein product [Heterobilharzia americana]